jgi:hypothetical protein
MDDRANLEAKWKEYEDELNRIARMTGLDQQLFGKREEELLAEQDKIEFALGFTPPVREGTQRYSGVL